MSVPTPLKELGKHRVVDMSLGPTHSTVLTELGHVSYVLSQYKRRALLYIISVSTIEGPAYHVDSINPYHLMGSCPMVSVIECPTV